MRILDIWWEGHLVGQLTNDRHGELGLAFRPEWLSDEEAQPLSASLPERAAPFTRRECRPFFGGLLPEENQRVAAAQVLGVSSVNDFALLIASAAMSPGALQLLPPGEVPAIIAQYQRSIALDDAGSIRVLDALPVRRERSLKHIRCDDRSHAHILGKPASARSGPQGTLAHQTFDAVQAA